MAEAIFDRRAPDISCDHCAATINGALKALHGVSTVDVDVDTKRVRVAYDATRIDPLRITHELEEQGYSPDSE